MCVIPQRANTPFIRIVMLLIGHRYNDDNEHIIKIVNDIQFPDQLMVSHSRSTDIIRNPKTYFSRSGSIAASGRSDRNTFLIEIAYVRQNRTKKNRRLKWQWLEHTHKVTFWPRKKYANDSDWDFKYTIAF